MSRSYFKIKVNKSELFNNSEILYIVANNIIDIVTVYDENFVKLISYYEFEGDNEDEDYHYSDKEKEMIDILDKMAYNDKIHLLFDAEEFVKLKETYYGKEYHL